MYRTRASEDYEDPSEPQQPAANKAVNFNSVLLVIVLALSGWTLKTVYEQAVSNSSQDKDILDLRARVAVTEKDVVNLRVRFANELGYTGRTRNGGDDK